MHGSGDSQRLWSARVCVCVRPGAVLAQGELLHLVRHVLVPGGGGIATCAEVATPNACGAPEGVGRKREAAQPIDQARGEYNWGGEE